MVKTLTKDGNGRNKNKITHIDKQFWWKKYCLKNSCDAGV